MGQLKINFEGLICHVGPNAQNKIRAVLVDERRAHKPRLRIVSGTIDPQAQSKIDLDKWDTISFENFDETPINGPARALQTFQDLVPGLKDLLVNGSIKPDVEAGKADQGVVAYFSYPAGELSAPEAHPKKLKIKLPNPKNRCVARGVDLLSDNIANQIIWLVITRRDANENKISVRKIAIKSDAVLDVENVSGSGNHFGEYLKLTGADDIAGVEKTDEDCEDGLIASTRFVRKVAREKEELKKGATDKVEAKEHVAFSASTAPECTNSGWP